MGTFGSILYHWGTTRHLNNVSIHNYELLMYRVLAHRNNTGLMKVVS